MLEHICFTDIIILFKKSILLAFITNISKVVVFIGTVCYKGFFLVTSRVNFHILFIWFKMFAILVSFYLLKFSIQRFHMLIHLCIHKILYSFMEDYINNIESEDQCLNKV